MLDAKRQAYLNAMGVIRWIPRDPSPAQPGDMAEATFAQDRIPNPGPQVATGSAPLDWDVLRERVTRCTQCPELAGSRTQTVFGVGDPQADWMVVGEAPGMEEDRQGEPFVGRAGQLLNAMLKALGLARQEVYIANILKCRPPRNRDPRPEEAACCEPYLMRQIELVAPRVILAVGRIAAQNLLGTEAPLGRLRGRVHRFGEAGLPLVVTYHPAYLLRSPDQKARAWQDLLLAASVVRGGDPLS
jgi:uracil-DNA glycosylase family 4